MVIILICVHCNVHSIHSNAVYENKINYAMFIIYQEEVTSQIEHT